MSKIIKISAVAAAVAITFSATSTIAATTFDKAYRSETSNIKQYSKDKSQQIQTRYIVQLEDEQYVALLYNLLRSVTLYCLKKSLSTVSSIGAIESPAMTKRDIYDAA